MMAEGTTFPIDATKTRLQLQGQAGYGMTQRLGFVAMLRTIIQTEGMKGLYAGVKPAIARHIPYTGFRAIGYEHIRGFFCGDLPKEKAPMWAKMASGITAGGIGQAIAVPMDLIKVSKPFLPSFVVSRVSFSPSQRFATPFLLATKQVRMIGDGRAVAEGTLKAPRYSGIVDAFQKIFRAEGMTGFYRGCWPAIQRAALVNLGELTTYDTAKNCFVEQMGDNIVCHISSAICSGFVASLCSTPADVAKSRIMAQVPAADGTLMYRGTFDCWRKVVTNEGFLALYKGFLPGWLRLAPWQLTFWITYEQLRIVTGLGGFK